MKQPGRLLQPIILIPLFGFLISCSKDPVAVAIPIPATVADIDGNVYHTVVIGDQVWLQENLKVKRYNNGDAIANVSGVSAWSQLNSGAWSYYLNDEQYNEPYGKMYNAYSIKDLRKICPKGWHVPTDNE